VNRGNFKTAEARLASAVLIKLVRAAKGLKDSHLQKIK